MRISRTLPIAIGASLVFLTGVADATSTTCANIRSGTHRNDRNSIRSHVSRLLGPAEYARELKAARKIETVP